MNFEISNMLTKNNKIILSIEGNIGSGKSTFLNLLKEKYKNNIKFVDEPVTDWLKVNTKDNKNLIENFYENKKRYGYLFQNFAYITRIRRLYDAIFNCEEQIIITERSVESDRYLFAELLEEDGAINKMEKQCYDYWYNFLNLKIDHFIYINTSVENCMKRIEERARSGEELISKDYINKLNIKHNKWLLPKKNMIILDGNLNFRDDSVIFEDFINQIKIHTNLNL